MKRAREVCLGVYWGRTEWRQARRNKLTNKYTTWLEAASSLMHQTPLILIQQQIVYHILMMHL